MSTTAVLSPAHPTIDRRAALPVAVIGAKQGEVGAKEKGKMRVEGKDYVVQDGDVVHFRVAT